MLLARTTIPDIIYLSFTENSLPIQSFSVGFVFFVLFIASGLKPVNNFVWCSLADCWTHYRLFATLPGPLLAIAGNTRASLISSAS